MWTLISSQLKYRIQWIFFAYLTAFILGCLVAWNFQNHKDSVERVLSITSALLFFGSVILHWAGWVHDLKERRILFFLSLPCSRWRIGLGYFLAPLFVQAGILITTMIPILGWIALTPNLGIATLGTALVHMSSISSAVLALFYFSYLLAEISIAFSYSKSLVYLINGVLMIAILAATVRSGDYYDWVKGFDAMILLTALNVVIVALTLVMFVRRENHTIGVHPMHGLPQDWSEAPG